MSVAANHYHGRCCDSFDWENLKSTAMHPFIRSLIPPALAEWRRAQKSRKEDRKYSFITDQNLQLKSAENQKKRCFIVGTGRSITKQNLRLLRGEVCLGLNEFFLHKDYSYIRPQYLVFSGFAVHNDPMEVRVAWYKQYEDKIKNISTPIINFPDYNFILSRGFLAGMPKFFIRFDRPYDELPDRGFDATKSLYESQSVSVMALQIAIYMGFKQIYLVGLDHDWLLRIFDAKPTHFYEQRRSIIYKNVREVEQSSFSDQLAANYRLFSQYADILAYAQLHSIAIFNATAGGLLDVFPRTDFTSLFA